MKKKSNEKLFIMIILIIAVIIISVYLIISAGSSIKVMTAAIDIKRGTVITDDNVNEYIKSKKVSKKNINEGTIYTEKEELYGMSVNKDIAEGGIVQKNDCSVYVDPSTKMTEPVEIGLKANEAAQFTSGTIRKGDHVNISVTDNVTGICETLLENVYVCGSYNSDGSEVSDDGCAMMINILIEKKDEAVINEKLQSGLLRISRIGSDGNE